MTDDPVAAAGLVVREVRTGARDGTTTRIVVARRTYATDRDDLWDALTNPERLPRWFLPVTGDLAVGGRYEIEGNAGGVVEQCAPPTSFAVTWEFGEAVSWLRVALRPDGGGTMLELSHEAPVDPMWGQYGPGAAGVGWDLALLGLGLHVDTGAAADAESALAFPTTPPGVDFVRRAATGWALAAIADGDVAEEAHAAADRTVEFYTVEPDAADTE